MSENGTQKGSSGTRGLKILLVVFLHLITFGIFLIPHLIIHLIVRDYK